MMAQSKYDCLYRYVTICDDDLVAHDRAMCVGFALVPPGWIVVIFATGFYHHGFCLNYQPEK
jgi:hypothetical protein